MVAEAHAAAIRNRRRPVHVRAKIAAGTARDAVVREILEHEAIPPSEFPSADLQQ